MISARNWEGGAKMFSFMSRAARLVCVPFALAMLTASPAHAQDTQRVPERIRSAFPQITLPVKESAGQEAVTRLGPNLSAVANWYGKSPAELRQMLLSDRRLRVDGKGRLFVVDEIDTPVPATVSGTPESVINGALVGLDQTFLLNSKPGANLTIYLDFNGATITGSAWNSNGNTITAVAFDTDGATGSFSTAELQRIQYIWQRVAEDYAPFDVNVTTQPPSPDQLRRNDSNDKVFGTTVVITNNSGVYSCSCGGVAYIGVFNSTSDFYKPALVFYNMLASGSEKSVAEAISHEAGHNMGLNHDGTSSASYYQGQGTDAITGWAPIMGVGYSKPLVQFSKGEYSGANNKENDFTVAQSYGLALRADDYGSSTGAATPFDATTTNGVTSGTTDGVIETATDLDVFAISSGAGSFTATLKPATRSPNADLVLTLLNSSGTVLATSNPLNALTASLNYQIPAQGTYYIQVKGTGQGDPLSTGYSSYGSVGNYRLTASYAGPSAGGIAPNAVLSANPTSGTAPLAVTLDARGSTDADGIKFYYWDFGNGVTDNTGTLSNTTVTYSTAGTYTARVTVVDNTGLSSSATKTITVTSSVTQQTVKALSIQMNLNVSGRYASATGIVTVVNQSGQVVPGATVAATWSGIVSRSSSGTTASTGKVSFTSPSTRSSGCFKLTVTKITIAGYTFSQSPLLSNQICR